ncbi:hypothetical protein XENOCAPTIV_010297, partial [Xenoophorus captivus]
FANPDFMQPISDVVDEVIQSCPIDVRRPLYKNIVLSGGSTMFRDFGRRLQRDLKRVVDARLRMSEELSAGRIKILGFMHCSEWKGGRERDKQQTSWCWESNPRRQHGEKMSMSALDLQRWIQMHIISATDILSPLLNRGI